MMRLVLLLTFSERNTYDLKATSGYKTVQCSPGVNQTLYLSPRGVSAGKGLNSIGTCYILSFDSHTRTMQARLHSLHIATFNAF